MEKTFTSVCLSNLKTSQTLTHRKDEWQRRRPRYMYTAEIAFFSSGKSVMSDIHIGVGFLRCPFSMSGQCEGLRYGADEGMIPTPYLYKSPCIFNGLALWGIGVHIFSKKAKV